MPCLDIFGKINQYFWQLWYEKMLILFFQLFGPHSDLTGLTAWRKLLRSYSSMTSQNSTTLRKSRCWWSGWDCEDGRTPRQLPRCRGRRCTENIKYYIYVCVYNTILNNYIWSTEAFLGALWKNIFTVRQLFKPGLLNSARPFVTLPGPISQCKPQF